MKAIFATTFYHVLVGTNSGSLWGFGGELPIFIRHHVVTKWEFVHFRCLLHQAYLGKSKIWNMVCSYDIGNTKQGRNTRIFGGMQEKKSCFSFCLFVELGRHFTT
jgi:hypothetical protein